MAYWAVAEWCGSVVILTSSSKVDNATGYDAVSERKQVERLSAGCLTLHVPKNVKESEERSYLLA